MNIRLVSYFKNMNTKTQQHEKAADVPETPQFREGGWNWQMKPQPAQAQHSPLPWEHNATQPFTRHDGEREDGYARAVYSDDTPVCMTNCSVGKYKAADAATQDANARLIVRSVNSADKLAEALRKMAQVSIWGKSSPLLVKARAALAGWEAGQ